MTNSYKKLNGVIIGVGSIGERHLYNLKKLGLKDISIYDSNLERARLISKKYNVAMFENIEKIFSKKPDFSLKNLLF